MESAYSLAHFTHPTNSLTEGLPALVTLAATLFERCKWMKSNSHGQGHMNLLLQLRVSTISIGKSHWPQRQLLG